MGLFYIDNFYGKSYGGNMTDLFRVGVIANTHGVRGRGQGFSDYTGAGEI